MENCSIDSNQAGHGAGIKNSPGSILIVDGSSILGYGSDESINYLVGTVGGTKVTTYQDGSARTQGAIGATGSNNTIYTVEHYIENLESAYGSLPEVREAFIGAKGSAVTPAVKTFEGFTAPATQTVIINADGSTVVKYEYTRNTYSLTIKYGNGDADLIAHYKFGEVVGVTLPMDITRPGHTLVGWNSVEIVANMSASDMTYSAIWEANMNEGWITNGHTATWTVSGDGKSVELTNNSLTSFFLSPDDFINKEITGTMEVQTTDDDDMIGFVLGYQDVKDVNSDGNLEYDFILFDWKQTSQIDNKVEWGSVNKTSEEGYTLSRMTAELTDTVYSGGIGNYSKYLWFHEAELGKYEIIETKYGVGNGWKNNTVHNFKIHYTQDQIIIWIDGIEIFSVSGNFKTGKFGFYNSSQENTVYANLRSMDI